MASSRVMASSSSVNSDLTRQSSIYSLSDAAKNLGSMNMEDLIHSMYGDGDGGGGGGAPSPSPFPGEPTDGGGGEASVSRQGSFTLPKGIGKTGEEVWRDISSSAAGRSSGGVGTDGEAAAGEMTLEDFLARTGAVTEEDVRGVFAADPAMQQLSTEIGVQMFGNGVEDGSGRGGGRGGRGRKRPLFDPADKAALQRQKRMIKNRESAARSRERKQAYTVELESLVTQLEEENAQLVRHQEEETRRRLKKLMEKVIPVTQERKPRRPLRRTHSMQW